MTGLVYLAIIALWVVFLIPWLGRQRDEQNGRRSADRYHRAKDSLSGTGLGRANEVSDDRVRIRETHLADDRDERDLDESPPSVVLPSPAQAWGAVTTALGGSGSDGGGIAAKRRRRVLAVLLVGLTAALVGSLAGVLPGATPALFLGLLVAYLTLLVRQAARTGKSGAASVPTTEADRYRQATRAAQEQGRGLIAAQQEAREAARRWDAVPTTLPTYVSKPKASKVPRVVDLTAPGRQWTGEVMVQRAQEELLKSRVAAAQAQFDREMSVMGRDPAAEVAALANPVEYRNAQRQTYRRAANG